MAGAIDNQGRLRGTERFDFDEPATARVRDEALGERLPGEPPACGEADPGRRRPSTQPAQGLPSKPDSPPPRQTDLRRVHGRRQRFC